MSQPQGAGSPKPPEQAPKPPAPAPTPAPAPKPPEQAPKPPQPAPAPAQASGDYQKVELVFNDKPVVKLDVPNSVNLDDAWRTFQDEHREVSDKVGAFPTSFAGDLVNKYGAKQVDSGAEGYTKKSFTVS